MYPFLASFVVGKSLFQIPSYGVMLAIGFSAAYVDAVLKAKRLNMDLRHVERLYILMVFGSIVGSRLFHVLFEELDYYLNNPFKIFAVWEGGYTFYGAALFCLVCLYVYCRAKKTSVLAFGDLTAGGASIGLAIGRFGCFLAGCCWGKPTTSFLGVRFAHHQSFCPVKNANVHPTQLYEAAGALAMYAYLSWLIRRRRYEGQILFHCLAIYSVLRFSIEFFRGDESRGYILNGLLSYSQIVSLCLFPLAIAGIVTQGKWRFLKFR